MRPTGFSKAETQAESRAVLDGRSRRCEVCHGVGLAGDSVPGRAPGDVIVWTDSTGFFSIEDDQGRWWDVDRGKSAGEVKTFLENERQKAHASVDERFNAIGKVLERRAMLPDQLFVPISQARLLDIEEAEAQADDNRAKGLVRLQVDDAEAAEDERKTKCDEAVEFVLALFAKSAEVAAKEAAAHAEAVGITRDALFRARRELRVEVRKNGRAGWYWRLPSKLQTIKS